MPSPPTWRSPRRPDRQPRVPSADGDRHQQSCDLFELLQSARRRQRWSRKAMTIETVSLNRSHDGVQGVYKHASRETGTGMTFSVYVPPHRDGTKLPVVWYLSGLTCTHANVTEKGEYRKTCAELGLIFVAPDTSPRGEAVPGDANNAYDFGLGAGFYVDATVPPFARNYRMWSYVTEELPKLVAGEFPVDAARQSIFGHSMGGHGALTVV